LCGIDAPQMRVELLPERWRHRAQCAARRGGEARRVEAEEVR